MKTSRFNIKSSRLLRSTLLTAIVVLSLSRIPAYLDYTKGTPVANNDLTPDYLSAQEWRHGGDAYGFVRELYARYLPDDEVPRQYLSVQRNAHPPILIVLLSPLSFLTLFGARVVWLVAMVVAAFLAIYLFCREIGLSIQRSCWVAVVCLGLPIFEFAVKWAQIEGLLLLAIVSAWIDLRHDRETRAGIVLGFITAVKFFPALLIVPLIRSGRWVAVRWYVMTAVATAFLGVSMLGAGPSRTYFFQASKENFHIWAAAKNGISLFAAPIRWLNSETFKDLTVPIHPFVWVLVILALGGCVVGAIWTRGAASGDMFLATVPWTILASPLAWGSYLVLAIPLGILLICNWSELKLLRRLILVPSLVLIALGQDFGEIMATRHGIVFSNSGAMLAAMSGVTAALLAVALMDCFPNRSATKNQAEATRTIA